MGGEVPHVVEGRGVRGGPQTPVGTLTFSLSKVGNHLEGFEETDDMM